MTYASCSPLRSLFCGRGGSFADFGGSAVARVGDVETTFSGPGAAVRAADWVRRESARVRREARAARRG